MYTYKVLPIGLCNAPTTFQREVLGIFFDILLDCVEIYMHDFTIIGNYFEETLANNNKNCRDVGRQIFHQVMRNVLVL